MKIGKPLDELPQHTRPRSAKKVGIRTGKYQPVYEALRRAKGRWVPVTVKNVYEMKNLSGGIRKPVAMYMGGKAQVRRIGARTVAIRVVPVVKTPELHLVDDLAA